MLFIKGKYLYSVRLAAGEPYLQFKDDGTMYGNNSGASDGALIAVKTAFAVFTAMDNNEKQRHVVDAR